MRVVPVVATVGQTSLEQAKRVWYEGERKANSINSFFGRLFLAKIVRQTFSKEVARLVLEFHLYSPDWMFRCLDGGVIG